MSDSQKSHATFNEAKFRSWDTFDTVTKHFFEHISLGGQYTPARGDDPVALGLQRQGIDILLTSQRTKSLSAWDIKDDYHPPNNFCLETYSDTSCIPWKLGWMHTSKASWILYNFVYQQDVFDSYVLKFSDLQSWFWPMHDIYRAYRVPDLSNHSISRIVPVQEVLKSVPAYHYLINVYGEVAMIPLFSLASEYINNGHIIKPSETRKITQIVQKRRIAND